MDDKMTIYYLKSNGKITAVSSGTQDMGYYGDNKEDYALIIDYVVLVMDKKVFFNFNDFKINIDTKTIEIKPEAIPNYPIASN